MPVKIFCSYSHRDRDLKEGLEEHLSALKRAGYITAYWSDDELSAGTEFNQVIRRELEEADLILVLLSPSYVNSDYCWLTELPLAMELREKGRARIFPIMLRPTLLDWSPLSQYTTAPSDPRDVASWPSRDKAFSAITRQIKTVIDEVQDHLALTGAGTTPALRRLSRNLMVSATLDEHESTVFHCIPQFDGPGMLRSTGITEILPDLVLQFRGDPGERRFADVWLYVNTPITSRIIGSGNLSEAVLSLATGRSITGLPTLRREIHARQGGASALGFLHVPLHELRSLPLDERNLRISSIRVNAAILGVSLTKHAEIQLFLRVSDTTVTAAQPLSLAHVAGTFEAHVVPAAQVDLGRLRQAYSLNPGMLTYKRTAECLTALVKCTGRFAEYEPVGERTRVQLIFANVPAGVCLFVVTEQVISVPATLSATLTCSDSFGNGPTQKPKIDGHVLVNGRALALSEIKLVDGVRYATWELDGGLSEETQTVTLGIVLAYHANPSQYLPQLGTATVICTLAPAGGPLAGSQTADANAPIPRFADASVVQELFSISP